MAPVSLYLDSAYRVVWTTDLRHSFAPGLGWSGVGPREAKAILLILQEDRALR